MKKQKRSKLFLIPLFIALILVGVWAGKMFLSAVYVPVIVMYHSIGEKGYALDGYSDKLNVFPETFRKQMKFLYDQKYDVIPLTELVEKIKKKEKIPHKTIVITFDDGLRNNFLNAYPALKAYGFPATMFVAVDFIGKENFLTMDDIRAMQKHNISIGSHTVLHRWLPSLEERSVRAELFDSKKILEERTGKKINLLSYPLGGHDMKVRAIAREAGYIGAVATNPGRKSPKDDIFALKRVRISMTSDNLLVFWIETSGYYTFIKEVRDED